MYGVDAAFTGGGDLVQARRAEGFRYRRALEVVGPRDLAGRQQAGPELDGIACKHEPSAGRFDVLLAKRSVVVGGNAPVAHNGVAGEKSVGVSCDGHRSFEPVEERIDASVVIRVAMTDHHMINCSGVDAERAAVVVKDSSREAHVEQHGGRPSPRRCPYKERDTVLGLWRQELWVKVLDEARARDTMVPDGLVRKQHVDAVVDENGDLDIVGLEHGPVFRRVRIDLGERLAVQPSTCQDDAYRLAVGSLGRGLSRRPMLDQHQKATSGSSGSGPRRNARVHDAIIDSTYAELAEVGYGRLTIQRVAARAGVGKATVYRWWGCKGELVGEALARRLDVTPVPDTGDTRAELIAGLMATARNYGGPVDGVEVAALATDLRTDPALLAAFREQFLAPRRAAISAVLARGVERGDLPESIDDALVQDIFAGTIFYRYLMSGSSIPRSVVVDLVDLVLSGRLPKVADDVGTGKVVRAEERTHKALSTGERSAS